MDWSIQDHKGDESRRTHSWTFQLWLSKSGAPWKDYGSEPPIFIRNELGSAPLDWFHESLHDENVMLSKELEMLKLETKTRVRLRPAIGSYDNVHTVTTSHDSLPSQVQELKRNSRHRHPPPVTHHLCSSSPTCRKFSNLQIKSSDTRSPSCSSSTDLWQCLSHRLTNVSIVRLKKGGKRFEVSPYQLNQVAMELTLPPDCVL